MQDEQFIDVDGVKVCYRVTGDLNDEQPVILFGHSYLWTADMWREQADYFKDQYTCIIPDLIAHGKSGVFADKKYSIERLADFYWRFMQRLKINEFIIVGLSIGGMWGAKLALDHPDAVKGLVLMDTFVGPEPEEKRQLYFGLLQSVENDGFTEAMLDRFTPFFLTADTLHNNQQLVERFKRPLRQHNNNDDRRWHLCELGRCIFTRNSLLQDLHKLTMPVHFITGAEDVPRPLEEARVMAKHCPQSQVIAIEHAAHISNLEQVEQVTKALAQFFPVCEESKQIKAAL